MVRRQASAAILPCRISARRAANGVGTKPFLRIMRIAHPMVGAACSAPSLRFGPSSRGRVIPANRLPRLEAQTRISEAREATGVSPSVWISPLRPNTDGRDGRTKKFDRPDRNGFDPHAKHARLHMEDGDPWQGVSLASPGQRGRAWPRFTILSFPINPWMLMPRGQDAAPKRGPFGSAHHA